MSSYEIDKKSQLPILYLQDQKEALWTKFDATYPDGMRKTAFMARLKNATHIRYRSDLGGLCIVCNEYGYDAFDDLISIAHNNFIDKELVSLLK
jgi:hypothetical protein